MDESGDNLYASLGADPVSSDNPCGENIRYESVFEDLEAELAKQESLTSETVDWNHVVTLSTDILKNSSKDLLVGAYLANGLLITRGYVGLANGLKVLSDMTQHHWDCLFPPVKRLRARTTAITWLSEKAASLIADKAPSAEESQAVIDAANTLSELDSTLVEKMGDQAPMLNELSRPLLKHRQSAEAQLAQAAKTTSPTAESPAAAVTSEAEGQDETAAVTRSAVPGRKSQRGSAASVAPSIDSIASDTDAKKSLRSIQDISRKASNYWLGVKLSDPRPYRISRMAAWLAVEALPLAADGVTQVNPPPAERIKLFDSLIEKAEYSAVLPELEQTLSRSPFWLDGQNKVVSVLRAMGGEYDNAEKTVIRETRSFLERVPGLQELSFSDQTPFASDQTKMWLSTEVMAGGAGAGGASTGALAGDSAWVSGLADARKKAAGGDMKAAMAIFSQGIATAGNVRDKYYWRSALADLLLQTGKTEAAAGILEQLAANAETYKLNEWEPDLVGRIYNLLYQSYRKQQGKKKDDKAVMENIRLAYEKLCWFDPITALTAEGD